MRITGRGLKVSKRRRNPTEEEEEEILDTVRSAGEDVMNEMSNVDAAITWSTPSDTDMDKYGEDMIIWAEFGWANAVNGDIVWADGDYRKGLGGSGDVKIPRGYHEVPGGGEVYSMETELSKDHVVDAIVKETGLKEEDVRKAINHDKRLFGDHRDVIYWGSSDGDATMYSRKKRA
jgi:hypothetical protein